MLGFPRVPNSWHAQPAADSIKEITSSHESDCVVASSCSAKKETEIPTRAPTTGDTEAVADSIEQTLQGLEHLLEFQKRNPIGEVGGNAAAAAAAGNAPVGNEAEMWEKLKAMNFFGKGNPIAQRWARAQKHDTLAKGFKPSPDKVEFRKQWAMGIYDTIVATKRHTTEHKKG